MLHTVAPRWQKKTYPPSALTLMMLHPRQLNMDSAVPPLFGTRSSSPVPIMPSVPTYAYLSSTLMPPPQGPVTSVVRVRFCMRYTAEDLSSPVAEATK